MKSQNILKLIVTSLAVLVILACNVTYTTGLPTPTLPPSPPTATPTPAGFAFVISPLTINESGANGEYKINAQIPAISGNDDPHALAFNSEMQTIAQGQIDEFKKAASETRGPVGPASLDGKYNLLFQNDAVTSLKFEFLAYTGGAHPYLNITTVNYDLAQSRQLALSDLFLPGSNYLETISNYCITELRKRFIDFDAMGAAGAAPTPENYDDWNITLDGLLITFDTYQVAPGASGPQTVHIPYSELQAVINPQGHLANFIK